MAAKREPKDRFSDAPDAELMIRRKGDSSWRKLTTDGIVEEESVSKAVAPEPEPKLSWVEQLAKLRQSL